MSLNCGSPSRASLSTLSIYNCTESAGQIQRIIFQRLYNGSIINSVLEPELYNSWLTLFAASNSTKVTLSPYIQNPNTNIGNVRKVTLAGKGGIPTVIGQEPTVFTAAFFNLSQVLINKLKTYMYEDIGVYLINEYSHIIGNNIGTEQSPVLSPIAINTLFISDKKLGGLIEPDVNSIEWHFNPNWSDTLYYVTPIDFNPLFDVFVTSSPVGIHREFSNEFSNDFN